MTDIATLGFRVDSSELAKADAALNKLPDSAKRAERATESLGNTNKATARATAALTVAQDASRAATSVLGSAVTYLRGAFAPLIGLLSAASAVEFARATFMRAAELREEAEQVGVSVEAYQAYREVMRENGIESDNAMMLMQKLTRIIGDAAAAPGPARDAMLRLGLTYADVASGAEDAIPKIATALLQIPDATTRARLEVDLFARGGQKLESALRALTDPTSTLIERQTALGHVMKKDVTEGADTAKDALIGSWEALQTSATPHIVNFMRGVTDLLDELNKLSNWKPGKYLDPSNSDSWLVKFGLFMSGVSTFKWLANQFSNGPDWQSSYGTFGGPSNDNTATGTLGNRTATGFSGPGEAKWLAQQKLAADLAGLSVVRRAQEEAVIARANARLADGTSIMRNQDGTLRKEVSSYHEARDLIGKTATAEAERYAGIAAGQKLLNMDRKSVLEGEIQTLQREGQQTLALGDDRAVLIAQSQVEEKIRSDLRQTNKGYTEEQLWAYSQLNPAEAASIDAIVRHNEEVKRAAAIWESVLGPVNDYEQGLEAIAAELARHDISPLAAKVERDKLAIPKDIRELQAQLGQSNLGYGATQTGLDAAIENVRAQKRARQLLVQQGLDTNNLSPATASNLTDSIVKDAERQIDALKKLYDPAFAEMQKSEEAAFDKFGDLIKTGNMQWKSWADAGISAIRDILGEMIQLSLLNPLKNEIFGPQANGQMRPTMDMGNIFSKGASFLAGLFHEGYDGYSRPTSYRAVYAPTLSGIPKYHTGLGGDEFLAVLQKGEPVLSRRQAASAREFAGNAMAAANNNSRSIVSIGGNTVVIQGDASEKTVALIEGALARERAEQMRALPANVRAINVRDKVAFRGAYADG